jgi:hypothetical protein
VTAIAVLATAALLVLAMGVRWWRSRPRQLYMVEEFATAREVTNRWSQDPTTTPQPVREFLDEQARNN